LIHGEADDVVPPGPVLEWCAKLPAPPKIVLLPGAGHFFHGRLAELARAVTEAFGAAFCARGGFDAA
jgi:alpha/beta superfamily hydrolase